MRTVQPSHVGLAFGALVAIWHAVWAAMVWFGWAQPILDFVFWVHFIRPLYVIQPFEAGRAATLVALAFFSGFALAWMLAVIWNWIARPRQLMPHTAATRRAKA